MRFLSRYTRFKIPGIHERREVLADGSSRQIRRGYMCEFEHGGLTDWERDYARTEFHWKGLPTALDGSPLDPVTDLFRVSVFDTDSIRDPEVRKQVEENLLANEAFGVDYVLVEEPRAPLPWPAYDRLKGASGRTVERIAAAVRDGGYDPEQVIRYERQNANREAVIDALAALPTATPAADDEMVTA